MTKWMLSTELWQLSGRDQAEHLASKLRNISYWLCLTIRVQLKRA